MWAEVMSSRRGAPYTAAMVARIRMAICSAGPSSPASIASSWGESCTSSRLLLRDELLAQLPLHDFAGARDRQALHKDDAFGHLIARQSALQVGEQRLRRALRLEDNTGHAHLAPARIGHADDGAHMDGRVLVKRLLDLRRVAVFAAGDEHVLFAIDDREIPILVVPGQVAGMEPALFVDDLGRGLRVAVVAGAEAGPFKHQLAHRAGGQGLV